MKAVVFVGLRHSVYVMFNTVPISVGTVTIMNVWNLIIEAFRLLVERDTILSERLAKLEEENGLEITDESITQTQLQELVARISEQPTPQLTVTE